jgi:cbb3-type cytochrome oxidase maturation protein
MKPKPKPKTENRKPKTYMDIIYFLIPMALVLVAGIVAGLFWAVKSGQFDDMEGPAHQIIMDEEIYPEEKDTETKND